HILRGCPGFPDHIIGTVIGGPSGLRKEAPSIFVGVVYSRIRVGGLSARGGGLGLTGDRLGPRGGYHTKQPERPGPAHQSHRYSPASARLVPCASAPDYRQFAKLPPSIDTSQLWWVPGRQTSRHSASPYIPEAAQLTIAALVRGDELLPATLGV